MLACDQCNKWFHGKCVNITEEDAKKRDSGFICPTCVKTGGPDMSESMNGEKRMREDGELLESEEIGQDGQPKKRRKTSLIHQRGERLCRQDFPFIQLMNNAPP